MTNIENVLHIISFIIFSITSIYCIYMLLMSIRKFNIKSKKKIRKYKQPYYSSITTANRESIIEEDKVIVELEEKYSQYMGEKEYQI